MLLSQNTHIYHEIVYKKRRVNKINKISYLFSFILVHVLFVFYFCNFIISVLSCNFISFNSLDLFRKKPGSSAHDFPVMNHSA